LRGYLFELAIVDYLVCNSVNQVFSQSREKVVLLLNFI